MFPLRRVLLLFFVMLLTERVALALPAFALREKVSCTLCHTNGSAPHLTKTGYMYRRAGFRFPTYIGNLEKDLEAMNLTSHMAAGANIDYEYVTNQAPGASEQVVNNDVSVREVEIWPVVGAFAGNYSAWTELDMSPGVAADRSTPTPPNSTIPSEGGVALSQADLRYVSGDADHFWNMRAGLIANEGFGASDQWLDDGNIPLMDQLTPQFNQDTLATPWGAMQTPQMGVEVGYNVYDTHITVTQFNGFDGTNGLTNNVQSTLQPVLTNPDSKGKDYKVQVDQFLGDSFAVTAGYYNGRISLLDPTNTMVWVDNFDQERLYLTYLAGKVDFMAGGALGHYDYVNSGEIIPAGRFQNRGGFVGANYYVFDKLTLSGRADYFNYNTGMSDANPRAQGYAFMASVPNGNTVWVFHYNRTFSDFSGLTNDFRLEWRFLF